ncbi:MAG: cytidyltransferase-related domain protein [Clostridia bacterium]|nr:cytidyltransferase-related domain protein [Clostridia bacterium]
MKSFKTGLVVGRFQHIHTGHEKLINIGLGLCDKLVIFVTYRDNVETSKNPYSVEYRIKLLNIVYEKEIKENKIVIYPFQDINLEDGVTHLWGKSIIDTYVKCIGTRPECIIYGKDKNINKCFEPNIVSNITEVFVDRLSLKISATEMRGFLINNNYEEWKKYANSKIHKEYDTIRNKLMKVEV